MHLNFLFRSGWEGKETEPSVPVMEFVCCDEDLAANPKLLSCFASVCFICDSPVLTVITSMITVCKASQTMC